MAITKVVLISKDGYNPSHDPLLESILDRGVKLFCAVGKDCQEWEDAMDALCESREGASLSVVTTSHPDESIEKVIEFANTWPAPGEVECITV